MSVIVKNPPKSCSEDSIETAQTFHKSIAGDSFNIAVAVSRLGSSVGYITKLGNDPFEKYLNEIYLKEFCFSPLKSLSLHLTNIKHH